MHALYDSLSCAVGYGLGLSGAPWRTLGCCLSFALRSCVFGRVCRRSRRAHSCPQPIHFFEKCYVRTEPQTRAQTTERSQTLTTSRHQGPGGFRKSSQKPAQLCAALLRPSLIGKEKKFRSPSLEFGVLLLPCFLPSICSHSRHHSQGTVIPEWGLAL